MVTMLFWGRGIESEEKDHLVYQRPFNTQPMKGQLEMTCDG